MYSRNRGFNLSYVLISKVGAKKITCNIIQQINWLSKGASTVFARPRKFYWFSDNHSKLFEGIVFQGTVRMDLTFHLIEFKFFQKSMKLVLMSCDYQCSWCNTFLFRNPEKSSILWSPRKNTLFCKSENLEVFYF